jgi:hypothetical protein
MLDPNDNNILIELIISKKVFIFQNENLFSYMAWGEFKYGENVGRREADECSERLLSWSMRSLLNTTRLYTEDSSTSPTKGIKYN